MDIKSSQRKKLKQKNYINPIKISKNNQKPKNKPRNETATTSKEDVSCDEPLLNKYW